MTQQYHKIVSKNGEERQIPFTSEEQAEWDKQDPLAGPFNELRRQRDSQLASSDWAVLPDSPLSAAKVKEWKGYRQALRDLPRTVADPLNPAWPEMPKG